MIRKKQDIRKIRRINVDHNGSFLQELMEQVRIFHLPYWTFFHVDSTFPLFAVILDPYTNDLRLTCPEVLPLITNSTLPTSKINKPVKKDLLLTGDGGERGLVKCLKMEHVSVRHQPVKIKDGDDEQYGTYTYVPLVIEQVNPVVVASDEDEVTGFFCEVLSPGIF